VKRLALAALAVIVIVTAAAAYQFAIRSDSLTPHLLSTQPIAAIGTGPAAVGVSPDGVVLVWQAAPRQTPLPVLGISAPPKSGRLVGTALQQVRILGAAPAALRPYLKASHYGKSGVDVELSSGVELRFGEAAEAARKWRAAAAVLADPAVTALDYVDLHVPSRPGIGGSGHLLPPPP
jgi:hypothetical protein